MHQKDNTLKKGLLHIGHLPNLLMYLKTPLSYQRLPILQRLYCQVAKGFLFVKLHTSTLLKHTVVYSNYISNITNKLLILAFTTLNPNRNLHYPPNVHQIYFGNRSFCNFRCSSMRRHSGQKSKIYIMV
jgi:hypothetical protein